MDAGRTVDELFRAFGRRDLDAVLALTVSHVELWPLGTAEELGRDEPYRGHDGLRAYFADVAAVWEELEIVPGELRVAASGVVAFGTAHGRTVDGAEHAGVPVVWVIRLEDGLVRSVRITPAGPRPGAG